MTYEFWLVKLTYEDGHESYASIDDRTPVRFVSESAAKTVADYHSARLACKAVVERVVDELPVWHGSEP